MVCCGATWGSAGRVAKRVRCSVNDLEAIFLDNWIGQNFLGDALEVFLGFVAVPAIQIEDEELALADVLHGRVTQAGESVLNCLSLGIEYRALWHYPDVCFHGRKYNTGGTAQILRSRRTAGRTKVRRLR